MRFLVMPTPFTVFVEGALDGIHQPVRARQIPLPLNFLNTRRALAGLGKSGMTQNDI